MQANTRATTANQTERPRVRSIVGRFFAFPLVWAMIGAATIVIGDGVLVGVGSEAGTSGLIVGSLVGAALSLALYALVMRFVARRRLPELLHSGAVQQLGVGLLIGAGFILASYGVVTLLGGYSFEWDPGEAGATIATVVAVNAGAAIVEELVFRGILLQAFERLLGPGVAVALSAVLFGLLHLFNPGATLWSSLAIAIQAGLFLGAAFLWRRSLWFVIGIHFSWNTVQGLLGIPVSGHRDPGLLVSTPHGADLLSGGDFGIEASIVPVVFGIVLAIAMFVARHRSRRS